MFDKTNFIHVHLFVLLQMFKYERKKFVYIRSSRYGRGPPNVKTYAEILTRAKK